jgi:aspartyl-tRNA(Asn)/glutamyl-tRNA(Gln) amidotransferase subunit B
VRGGTLHGVALTRIHLEEDTARSQHEGDKSLIDYNRAGVPLMELVTEPVIHSAEEAGSFAKELQLLLRSLGAGEANMEKGEMRVEANISVSTDDTFGTKVEVKNLNSFRSVERAIAYEIGRQSELLEGGGVVVQETRGWDENKQITFSQRKKESSHDYRYFPDPDLPSLRISEIKEFADIALPELPSQKRERLQALGFLQTQDIEQLVTDVALANFFEEVQKQVHEPELIKIAANFILNDIAGKRKKDPMWLPQTDLLAEVVRKYADGTLASPQAKSSLISGGIAQVTDESVLPVLAQKIIDANPSVVAEYKAGKESALQFLIGQGMKESKGSANPQALRLAIQKILA